LRYAETATQLSGSFVKIVIELKKKMQEAQKHNMAKNILTYVQKKQMQIRHLIQVN
jgi:hypothetical protein